MVIDMLNLYGRGKGADHLKIWSIGGSFFWKCLQKLKPLFHWSTQWQIGNGRGISFELRKNLIFLNVTKRSSTGFEHGSTEPSNFMV